MHDSSYTSISGLPPANFKPLTPEETVTYRGWRRAVVAFYCCVVLLGGFALLASVPAPHQGNGAGDAPGERSLMRFRNTFREYGGAFADLLSFAVGRATEITD